MPIPHDTIDKLEETFHALSDIGARLTEEQWKSPTDLPGWTVQDNYAHLIGTERMRQGLPATDRRATGAREDLLVLVLEDMLLHLLVHQEGRVTDLLHANAAEHLPHDHLDVLVVDENALQAVNLLDLVHEPSRELALAP